MLIYFIQIDDDGPIKIGKANNANARLRGLQTAHHKDLRIIHLEETESEAMALALEASYHAKFNQHRIRGEWFRPHTDILEFIGQAPITWKKIIAIEPDMNDLYADASVAEYESEDYRFYCPKDHLWYRHFKKIMLGIVGFGRKVPPDELKTTDAYEIAYRKIYGAMPCPTSCPNCL